MWSDSVAARPPDWSDEDRLARTVSWTAATLSLLVAVTVPLGYFGLSYQANAKESAVAARLHAAFVMQAIADRSTHWQGSVEGLIDADLAPGELPEQRRIVDRAGHVVTISGAAVPPPLLITSAPLLTHEGEVGSVQIQRSLAPLLWRTTLVAVVAALFGGAIFLTLRTLPLRALRRTLQALRREEAKAREEAEATLRVVFEHAVEGILLYDEQGEIKLANPAAARMFGTLLPTITGSLITHWLRAETAHLLLGTGQFEAMARRQAQGDFPVDVAISRTHFGGAERRIAVVRDITERKQNEARLAHLANYDSLTGLPNRSLFRDRLEQAMARAQRHGRPMALMFLDLDRFKTINDSLGHEFGDKLLVAVSRLLANCLRESDSVGAPAAADGRGVYRLGGDEFTVLVEDLSEANDAAAIARRILEALTRPLHIDGEELFISTSIGITLYPQEETDLDALVRQADMAMYRSKELGRGTFFFYSSELNEQASQRHLLEAALRHALERGEFRLVYQPKAELASGRVSGVEALLRWRSGGVAPIGPDRFVPILEETGLIVPVGLWVLRTACEQMMAWRREGLEPMNLAVNLSARQFRQQDLLQSIAQVLVETGLEPQRLEVELTESMLVEDTDAALQIIAGLGELGVRVAIDDFGTGHSSLSYLKRFNLHTLKIDRSFVRDTPGDAEDCAITRAVIALAHSLHLKVVAEGVETPDQVAFLRAQGCDEMQGFLLSRPLDPPALGTWLQRRREALPAPRPATEAAGA